MDDFGDDEGLDFEDERHFAEGMQDPLDDTDDAPHQGRLAVGHRPAVPPTLELHSAPLGGGPELTLRAADEPHALWIETPLPPARWEQRRPGFWRAARILAGEGSPEGDAAQQLNAGGTAFERVGLQDALRDPGSLRAAVVDEFTEQVFDGAAMAEFSRPTKDRIKLNWQLIGVKDRQDRAQTVNFKMSINVKRGTFTYNGLGESFFLTPGSAKGVCRQLA